MSCILRLRNWYIAIEERTGHKLFAVNVSSTLAIYEPVTKSSCGQQTVHKFIHPFPIVPGLEIRENYPLHCASQKYTFIFNTLTTYLMLPKGQRSFPAVWRESRKNRSFKTVLWLRERVSHVFFLSPFCVSGFLPFYKSIGWWRKFSRDELFQETFFNGVRWKPLFISRAFVESFHLTKLA